MDALRQFALVLAHNSEQVLRRRWFAWNVSRESVFERFGAQLPIKEHIHIDVMQNLVLVVAWSHRLHRAQRSVDQVLADVAKAHYSCILFDDQSLGRGAVF